MLHAMHPSRQRRHALVGVPILLAFVLALTTSCANSSSDMGSSEGSAPPTEEGLATGLELLYDGETSLAERIARSDVIARVRLRSVSPAVDFLDIVAGGTFQYHSGLEHRFQALEYLKGSGGGELMAVVYDGHASGTSQSAIDKAADLLAARDAQWDSREAIVFLREGFQQSDRYVLGGLTFDPDGFLEDAYSVASIHTKNWLPEVTTGGERSPSTGNQRFLLGLPGSDTEGSSSRSALFRTTEPTITIGDLKARIGAIEGEVAGGGGSQAYRDCVYEKFRWEREVRHLKEALGGTYFYLRYDEATASGLPAESLVFTSIQASHTLEAYGPTPPPASNWGEFRLVGEGENLFHPRWPGVAVTARPLPADEYRFYYAYRPPEYVICDAHPEEELKRFEVFVTVTAPAGTLHEALFDPAAIGAAVGADAANGVVEPAGFTAGGTATTITGLKWEGGTVTLELSPAASLSGYDVDVIELDGSVSLTLSVAGATSNTGGTLTWDVSSQPWHAGDQLMLRLRTA